MRPTPLLTALALTAAGLALAPSGSPAAAADRTGTPDPVAVVDPPAVRPGATGATPHAAWAAATGTDAFALHSDPGSQHVIYLDFDGGTVSGTAWPAAANGVEPAFSLDGDPTTFSASERAFVTTVWQWVSEDYAPFDVDVTTQDPGDAAIDRTSSSDPTYGTRVLITPSATAQQAVCGGQCGGGAFVGAFDATGSAHARYQPAWVFPQALPVNAAPDPKYVADAAAHEAGHTLGLSHDGLGTADYYDGHDPWGPIMGDPYDQPLSQWSDGDYTGATETEDDVAVIAATGAPRRADEAGGTVATAAPATGTDAGIIGDRTDVDDYALGTCSGTVTLTATPAAVGPDLDVSLSLLRADGTVIASADPATARVSDTQASNLGASITVPVPAGTRAYASVDGGGLGTPDTGYSDYGSLGRYTLSSSGCTSDGSGSGGGGTATAPGAPTGVAATVTGTTARVTWAAPTDPGPGVTGYQVSLDGRVVATTDATTTSAVLAGLVRGTTATVEVRALAGAVAGAAASTQVVVPAVAPSAPAAPVARSGARGGTVTASLRWQAPADGGAAIAGYRVVATLLDAAGHVTGTGRLTVPASATGVVARFARAGRVRFAVQARNSVGWGPLSRASAVVRAR